MNNKPERIWWIEWRRSTHTHNILVIYLSTDFIQSNNKKNINYIQETIVKVILMMSYCVSRVAYLCWCQQCDDDQGSLWSSSFLLLFNIFILKIDSTKRIIVYGNEMIGWLVGWTSTFGWMSNNVLRETYFKKATCLVFYLGTLWCYQGTFPLFTL